MWETLMQIIDLVKSLFTVDQLNGLVAKFMGPILSVILGE